MRTSDQELRLRIVVVDPPAGVVFALRRGKQELVSPTMATGADLSFDLTVPPVRPTAPQIRVFLSIRGSNPTTRA